MLGVEDGLVMLLQAIAAAAALAAAKRQLLMQQLRRVGGARGHLRGNALRGGSG